ncbi:MAG: hypothetical protein IMZ64_06610 [Bacteroidetes bacterium]|nr:hypothetical protein [Bacteroidota bacterium]
MIKITFTIKKSLGKLGGMLTTLSKQRKPKRQGVVRLKSLSTDKSDLRLRTGQLVITPDGLGTIKEYMAKKDDFGRLILPAGVNVAVRNLEFRNRIYHLGSAKVVDIIDVKSGDRYPAAESCYSRLVADDAPVEFVVTKKGRALLTDDSVEKLDKYVVFAKRRNGIRLLNELIEKQIWNPTKK